MTVPLPETAWWPIDALGEALNLVASRLGGEEAGTPLPPPPANDADALPQWIGWAAARVGVEALPIAAEVRELPAFCAGDGPALVIESADPGGRFLLLAGGRARTVRLIGRGGGLHSVRLRDLIRALTSARHDTAELAVTRVLDAAGLEAARRARTLDVMVRQRIAAEPVEGLFLLRIPASAPFDLHLRAARVPARLAAILGMFALLYAGEIAGWRLIGGAALEGRLDLGWLAAWLLLLVTLAPGQWLARQWQGRLAQDFGRLLRARLFAGALELRFDAMRREGVGGMIGRVMEAEALETAALGGAMALLVALIELALAAWVLAQGAAPGAHLGLLALWSGAGLGVALAFHRRVARWTASRVRLTADMVAAMIGHRTRLAQQDPAARIRAEDTALARYAATARTMDRAALALNALLGPGWSLAALLALAPAVVAAAHPPVARIAISLGGILLAQRAIGGIAGGFLSLSRAKLAWDRVRDMLLAAGEIEGPGTLPPTAPMEAGGPLVAAHGLRFAHDGADRPVLDALDLTIGRGERILVEGPSGGGKSTLAAVLAGLRRAQRGLLTAGGLDRPTLGADWHRHVGAAPQFHENHVLAGTLAFNLLMGRAWPPSQADLAETMEVCEDLGLGDLVRRMPAGLHQRIGESGWQLSHGERSRVFLARAILAQTPLTILDESFGPLDPETLEECLAATIARTDALMVIAHP